MTEMPTIPHVEERKRLAELLKRLEALEREEKKILAPLEAEARKHREDRTSGRERVPHYNGRRRV
jgi:hypothetical protein